MAQFAHLHPELQSGHNSFRCGPCKGEARRTKCRWFDEENLRTYVRPHADCSTFRKVASPGNKIRSFTVTRRHVRTLPRCKNCGVHLFSVIVRPVLPDEMQQAVLAVLEENRALSRIRVDEVGVPAPERATSLECESGFGHLCFGIVQASRRERGSVRSSTFSAQAQRTRHLRDRALAAFDATRLLAPV